MIRHGQDYRVEVIPGMKGGSGKFVLEHVLKQEELCGKGRTFARGTLKPGCTVGEHRHEGDMEVCFFLSGEGAVLQEGRRVPVKAGDCNICGSGEVHAIENTGTENLVYMVLILYTD